MSEEDCKRGRKSEEERARLRKSEQEWGRVTKSDRAIETEKERGSVKKSKRD